jgi:hypothetical protein
LPEAIDLTIVYPKGFSDAILGDKAVLIGVHLLERVFKVLIAQQLLFVGRCC